MKQKIMLDKLTRSEISEVSRDSLVILPLGATEQHGEHLTIAVDHFIASEIAERSCLLVREHFPTLVAPVMPYGSSHHHRPYPTLSLSNEVLLAVLKDLLRSFALMGFQHVAILNAHGGNDEAIRMATRDIAKEQNINIACSSYWSNATNVLEQVIDSQLGDIPGHAGGFETSLMLALDEEQVKMKQRPERREASMQKTNNLYIQTPENSVGLDGYSDDSSYASKELGEKMLKIIVEEVSKDLIDFKNNS